MRSNNNNNYGYERFEKRYPKVARGIKYAKTGIEVAGQAYTIAKTIAAVINSEKKYYDVESSVASSITGSVIDLTNIVAGTGATTRTGDSILHKSLQLNMNMLYAVDGNRLETNRVMVVRQLNNENVAGVQISDVVTQVDPTSLRKMLNRNDYEVIMDKTLSRDENQLSVNIPVFKSFKSGITEKGKAYGIHQKFQGASKVSGGIYLMVWGNSVTNPASLYYSSRLRFMDN